MFSEKRFLIIGAHPDDPDLMFGGCAVKLVKNGHKVKFVSCCNGDAGHYSENPEKLAKRRWNEAQKSAKCAGIEEYEILDNHDCEIIPSIENRKKITTIIREFKPDVVISHRVYDYHADHRATAQLVQDSSYLVTVPMFCPKIQIPEKDPIYLFSYDSFKKPYPFSPDITVAIDDVIPEKLQMLNCHESQFYEWLPYNQNRLQEVPETYEDREKWLTEGWLKSNMIQAELTKPQLLSKYGKKQASIKFAETFELSEYNRQAIEELYEIFSI